MLPALGALRQCTHAIQSGAPISCHLHLIKCFLLQAALVPKCKATDSLLQSRHCCGKHPVLFGTSTLLTHARSSVRLFSLLSLLTSLAEFQSHCNTVAFSNGIACFLTLNYLESGTCSVYQCSILRMVGFLEKVCIQIVFSVYVSLSFESPTPQAIDVICTVRPR